MRDDWDDKEISFVISPNLILNLVSEELEKKYLSSYWRIRLFNAMQIWTQFETFLRSLEETCEIPGVFYYRRKFRETGDCYCSLFNLIAV